jgi:hypothetical protein
MKDFQSHTFSNKLALTNDSVNDVPSLISRNNWSKESTSCRFNVLEMMLNHWFISSCVCPTIKKDNCTSLKYPCATKATHKPNMSINQTCRYSCSPTHNCQLGFKELEAISHALLIHLQGMYPNHPVMY